MGVGRKVLCQVQCDVSLPSVLMKRLTTLIQNGEISEFYMAAALTTGAAFHMNSLWNASNTSAWKLFALSESTALHWSFFCQRQNENVTVTIKLRFHESGFVFVMAYDGQGREKGSMMCLPVNECAELPSLILSTLDSVLEQGQ